MNEENKTIQSEQKKAAASEQKPIGRVILEDVLWLGAVIVAALLIVRFVAVRSIVEGESMHPFLENKDNLIVQKISYYFHAPERFDVVVFELKDEPNIHYIKRVIGLPGETVQIIDGYVYINGEKLKDDTYCSRPIDSSRAGIAASPLKLGENEYFVLGDNRNNSRDSRTAEVGPVKRKQIVGKAWIRIWPITGIKYVGR